MKISGSGLCTVTGLLLLALAGGSPAEARVGWEAGRVLQLERPPLDVAGSVDGKWTFVLAEGGKVYIYSTDGVLKDTISVDAGMDRLAVPGTGERIYLSSRKDQKVQEILVEFVMPIDTKGSPFLGAANAPVELVVFSDFQ